MKVKKLIDVLKSLDTKAEIYLSSDPERNMMTFIDEIKMLENGNYIIFSSEKFLD